MSGPSGVPAPSHVEGGCRHVSELVRDLAMDSVRNISLKLTQWIVTSGSVFRESGASGVLARKAGTSGRDVTRTSSVSTRRGSVGGMNM